VTKQWFFIPALPGPLVFTFVIQDVLPFMEECTKEEEDELGEEHRLARDQRDKDLAIEEAKREAEEAEQEEKAAEEAREKGEEPQLPKKKKKKKQRPEKYYRMVRIF
jgi:hypothetical protein